MSSFHIRQCRDLYRQLELIFDHPHAFPILTSNEFIKETFNNRYGDQRRWFNSAFVPYKNCKLCGGRTTNLKTPFCNCSSILPSDQRFYWGSHPRQVFFL